MTGYRREAGVALPDDSALFRDLALEHRRLRAHTRDRRVPLADHGARGVELTALVVGDDGDQTHGRRGLGCPEQGNDAPSIVDRGGDRAAERLDRRLGNLIEANRAAVPDAG